MAWLRRSAVLMCCLFAAGCADSPGPVSQAPVSQAPVSQAPVSRPAVSPSSAVGIPVVGVSRGSTVGYGQARPREISNGGDPTGIVTGITWTSWGGPHATGTGMAYYDPPGVPVDQSVLKKAAVVAFDLGTCSGQYMYQAIEWYFPAEGGSFNPSTYLNVCSWTYHPPGGP